MFEVSPQYKETRKLRWDLTSKLYELKKIGRISKDRWKPVFERYTEISDSPMKLRRLIQEVATQLYSDKPFVLT